MAYPSYPDWHGHTLDDLFREWWEAYGDRQAVLLRLTEFLRSKWHSLDGTTSPEVETNPVLLEGWRLIPHLDSVGVLAPDGSVLPGAFVRLFWAEFVMLNGKRIRRSYIKAGRPNQTIMAWPYKVEVIHDKGASLDKCRAEAQRLSDIPGFPVQVVTEDGKSPGETESAPDDAKPVPGAAADKSSEATARSQLRWPQPSDKMKPTGRQQIVFSILEADGRFSKCRNATEMLEVMPLARMVKYLLKPKWPKKDGKLVEGRPLERDALKEALYKFFPDRDP